jgi:hypothetical protein
MATGWIVLIVLGGLALTALAAVAIWLGVRNLLRQRSAWAAFGAQRGFVLEQVAGMYGPDPQLRGQLDGMALEIRQVYRPQGSGRGGRLLTAFRVEAAAPWPGGLIAYTPGFSQAIGGAPGTIIDNHGVRGVYGRANDVVIGDAELDRALAIDCSDAAQAGALLRTPAVKQAVLAAVKDCGHIRIREREVVIEADGRVTSVERLVAHGQHAVAVARALIEAVAEIRSATLPRCPA